MSDATRLTALLIRMAELANRWDRVATRDLPSLTARRRVRRRAALRGHAGPRRGGPMTAKCPVCNQTLKPTATARRAARKAAESDFDTGRCNCGAQVLVGWADDSCAPSTPRRSTKSANWPPRRSACPRSPATAHASDYAARSSADASTGPTPCTPPTAAHSTGPSNSYCRWPDTTNRIRRQTLN